MATKETKRIYFGADKLAEYEAKLDAIGEALEAKEKTPMRGNNGKISHAAVIKKLIENAHDEIEKGD